jgi:GNAT superfamily N-acetyltransferase
MEEWALAQGEMAMATTIRKLETRDEARWRELWEGYRTFYEQAPNEAVTRHLWSRLMDGSSVRGVLAEVPGSGTVGIAHYIPHESTATLTPICVLQDLFVDPASRTRGVGASLIEWLIAEAKSQGWARVYWHTRENNYRARGLYDKYAKSGFLRYVAD